MGLFNKIKKSIELKQNIPNLKSIEKTEKKISLAKNTHSDPQVLACIITVS